MENKKRLIDADALMDVIREHEYRLATKQGAIDYGMFTLGIQQAIDEQPTIDAVPVVRCRECKYSRITHIMKKDVLSCENIDVCGEEYLFERNPNDFCSYGERKGGAD